MTLYADTCSITAMSLLYGRYDMVKCMCYMGLESNGCFMAGGALTGGHYRTNIISGVGHPRLDSVVPLVLCTAAYNILGTSMTYKALCFYALNYLGDCCR
jgi:hypothetical protein